MFMMMTEILFTTPIGWIFCGLSLSMLVLEYVINIRPNKKKRG